MARPLPSPKLARGGLNGTTNGRPAAAAAALLHPAPPPVPEEAGPTSEELQELERLREENEQLRALCIELEQALNEATQHAAEGGDEERVKEYEALLDEKTELIRQLHEQLQEAQAAAAEPDAQSGAPQSGAAAAGPAPHEDELLTLSEDLERERRQLQEDEQALMQQMREMEVTMGASGPRWPGSATTCSGSRVRSATRSNGWSAAAPCKIRSTASRASSPTP